MKRSYKSVRPGWKMTEEQSYRFFALWADACAGQGWDRLPAKEREAKRHEVLASLGFASVKDVGKTDDFTKVQNHLIELAGGLLTESAEEGKKRTILHRIGETIAALEEAGYPAASLQGIYRDFGIIPGVRSISVLDADRLLTMSRTLTRIAGEWKEKQECPV